MKKANSPWELFVESCGKYRQELVLIYNDRTYSYEEIYEQAVRFSELIGKWSFRMGGVYLPNCPAFLISMLGLNASGKVFVSLSYQFKGDALIELLDYADVELLITDTKGWEAIRDRSDSHNVRVVLEVQADETFRVHEVPDKLPRPLPELGADTFGICFTSGSTARPKGILLSNRAVVGNACAIAERLDFQEGDRTILPRSLAQASPIAGDVFMAISRGGAIILMNNVFHPAIFLKAIQDHGANQFYIVRTMLLQMLEYPGLKSYDLHSLKRILIGGMINPIGIYQEAARCAPEAKVYNAYGASEAVARVTLGLHDEVINLPWVIGKPIDGCSIKILREDGTEAEVDEIGELFIQSDYLMDGYYKQEQATREVLTPNGLRVKDIGYRDAEGRFYVLSRSDDMISQGGSRAYPADIEEVLLRHEAISEAVVLGVEDRKLGQRIVAFVCLKEGRQAASAELFRWCAAQLEDRKVPKEIHIVASIPRNVIGKINKKEVKAMYDSLLQTGS
ncbi:class I adenylate-forming enzyme family protein [Gorillibacterium timonense]|uniref:class I adenylate-forming enzyme family protein n=1 Tax=Gorillibacterium timonense TaxID=1689269 RepID=UPI00071CD79E|nr:class I adenylate-forming enzyme family protein [Gorillibacterium timonense]